MDSIKYLSSWMIAGLIAFFLAGCSPPVDPDPQVLLSSHLTVAVRNSNDEPMPSIQVMTYPETTTMVTDEHGMAKFENLKPNQQYQIVISGEYFPLYYQNIIVSPYPQVIQFTIAVEVTLVFKVKDSAGT